MLLPPARRQKAQKKGGRSVISSFTVNDSERIVIIGNGAAANAAADTIRSLDPRRPITMIAREGFPLYSACALPDSLSGWVDRKQVFLKSLEDYGRAGIETLFGCEVLKIDPDNGRVCLEERDLSYGALVIATGSRAIVPPVPGSGLTGNFVVKSIADIDAIRAHSPRQVVVVGSGNIGVEMAEALEMQGCQVTIVEMMDRIFPRIFDAEPARRIAGILTDHGIGILTSEKLLEVVGEGRVAGVITNQRSLECDTVIWAAGVRQNVELARQAGLDIGALGGIAVDEYMQTSAPGIYAAGDCIESTDLLTGRKVLSLLWPSARAQGQVAALNIMGQNVKYQGSVSLVMEDIYGTVAFAMGGTASDWADSAVEIREGEAAGQYWRIILADDRIAGMQGLNALSGMGAVMALMRKGTTLSQYREAMADPAKARSLAWYLPARRFLED